MRIRPMFLFPLFVIVCSAASLLAQQTEVSSAASNSVASPIPRLIKYSGTLLDEQGRPMKSPVGVTFSLYAQQSDGAALWMETQNVETDAKGNYTVLLGANSPNGIPMELFNTGEARWLGAQAEHQPEQPRVLLVSVPYALQAGNAQMLGGLPASAFVLGASAPNSSPSTPPLVLVSPGFAPGMVPGTAGGNAANNLANNPLGAACSSLTADGTATANQVSKFTAPCTIHQSLIFDNGTNVGIGNTSPAAKLDVSGGATVRGALTLPATGTATSSTGSKSNPLDALASAFNSSSKAAVSQHFRWQAEPVGNNTSSPSGKFNLLFASGSNTPAETGLSINKSGQITFASGQTFPGGTVTGTENFQQDITLMATTGPGVGVIDLGGHPFLQACCPKSTDNMFVGPNAGNFTADAISSNGGFGANAAVGSKALQALTSGFENTALGFEALLSNNTGTGNTASGMEALIHNAAGSFNTALGKGAGFDNTTGSNNTFIGADSGSGGQINLFNATAIGANATVTANNALVLGGTGANAVNVGIGTTAPTEPLEVNGTMYMNNTNEAGVPVAGVVVDAGGLRRVGLMKYSGLEGSLVHNNATVLRIGRTTNTDITQGTLSNFTTDVLFDTPGDVIFKSNVGIGPINVPDESLTIGIGSADKPGGGSWDSFSDARLKTVEGRYEAGLKAILKLTPVHYRYKAQNAMGIQDDQEHVGFVAQDVEKVIPEAVKRNSQGYLLVNNDPILWTMLNAIKQQQAEIERLVRSGRAKDARILKLTEGVQEFERLGQKMEALEERLAQMEAKEKSGLAVARVN
jgi:hypothetical protein